MQNRIFAVVQAGAEKQVYCVTSKTSLGGEKKVLSEVYSSSVFKLAFKHTRLSLIDLSIIIV